MKPGEYLTQWKGVSNYLGIPVGTIRHWHYKVLPLPYRKSVPRRSGRVVVEKKVLDNWRDTIMIKRKIDCDAS